MIQPYRLLIVDDHPLARKAVRALLEDEPNYRIVGEACNGLEALACVERLLPDVVLMDIHMPEMNGLEATRCLKEKYPAIKIVLLSVSDAVADLFAAVKYGAQGYLLKNMDPAESLHHLNALLADQADIPTLMADRLFFRFKEGAVNKESSVNLLTPRELEIIALVAEGATNRQIADQLVIAENTVKNHMKNMLEKLGLENRVQLAAFATKNGIERRTKYKDSPKES